MWQTGYAVSSEMWQLKALEIVKEIECRASTKAQGGCRSFLNKTINV
jgi:hypothetical protein